MVVNEILRGTVSFSAPSASVAQIVLHWILTGGTVPDTLVASDVAAWLLAELLDRWAEMAADSSTADFVQFDVINTDGTVNRNLPTEVLDLDGDVASDISPAGVSAFMYATTAAPKVRGRKFFPFLTDATLSNGLLTSGALVSLATAFNDYISEIDLTGPGVLEPGVLSTVSETFVQFNEGGTISDVPAYQRRRKPNVGS